MNGLIQAFGPPAKMAEWSLAAMVELRESICRDFVENKIFAWYTRLRQPEELYIKTLYALFVASEPELHHLLSGEMPNSLARLYEKVNEVVFLGRGLLQTEQAGLTQGTFKPADMLNDGAHASFSAFMSCIGLIRNPQFLPSAERYWGHLKKYCDYLNYMHEMFKAGKEKKHVLQGVINLHRPASDWKVPPPSGTG